MDFVVLDVVFGKEVVMVLHNVGSMQLLTEWQVVFLCVG